MYCLSVIYSIIDYFSTLIFLYFGSSVSFCRNFGHFGFILNLEYCLNIFYTLSDADTFSYNLFHVWNKIGLGLHWKWIGKLMFQITPPLTWPPKLVRYNRWHSHIMNRLCWNGEDLYEMRTYMGTNLMTLLLNLWPSNISMIERMCTKDRRLNVCLRCFPYLFHIKFVVVVGVLTFFIN